jgi:hypothetical protein
LDDEGNVFDAGSTSVNCHCCTHSLLDQYQFRVPCMLDIWYHVQSFSWSYCQCLWKIHSCVTVLVIWNWLLMILLLPGT